MQGVAENLQCVVENLQDVVPEEGWFGQPKYSTPSKIHSTLYRFLPSYSLLQKTCRYCRKSAECCRFSAGIAENLQVLEKIRRMLLKICRVLQIFCR